MLHPSRYRYPNAIHCEVVPWDMILVLYKPLYHDYFELRHIYRKEQACLSSERLIATVVRFEWEGKGCEIVVGIDNVYDQNVTKRYIQGS